MKTTIAKIYETLGASSGGSFYDWLNARGSIATSGDNPAIAAPGVGKRLVLAQFTIQNVSTASTTVIVKHGATAVFDVLLDFKGDGLRENYPAGNEVRLPENTGLVLNLSGANTHNWAARYRVEDL